MGLGIKVMLHWSEKYVSGFRFWPFDNQTRATQQGWQGMGGVGAPNVSVQWAKEWKEAYVEMVNLKNTEETGWHRVESP